MEKVVLSLGSNFGNRLANLRKCVKLISFLAGFDLLAASGIYETKPWGYKKQRKFLNCVIAGLYKGSVNKLFRDLENIEKECGRIERGKWMPREIDIDILFYGTKIINKKNLTIPHPELQNRKFVLKPLAVILPGLVHPVLNKNISYLLKYTKDTSAVMEYNKSVFYE